MTTEMRTIEVDVPSDLRLDTKAGVAVAVEMIPSSDRRGATSYRAAKVSRPVDGRKVVTFLVTFRRVAL